MPSSVFVDPGNGDVYVSDGESRNGNRRIAVIDRYGAFLRQWQPEGMQTVHCLTVSADGWVYVCNREGSRIQVYDKMDAFARNIDVPWKPATPPANGDVKESGGSAVALALSRDSAQRMRSLHAALSMDAAPTATGDAARQALLAALAKMR
jgi:DNA-binding beta-propeller fold protein YncE